MRIGSTSHPFRRQRGRGRASSTVRGVASFRSEFEPKPDEIVVAEAGAPRTGSGDCLRPREVSGFIMFPKRLVSPGPTRSRHRSVDGD
jgi:hypothetical protein